MILDGTNKFYRSSPYISITLFVLCFYMVLLVNSSNTLKYYSIVLIGYLLSNTTITISTSSLVASTINTMICKYSTASTIFYYIISSYNRNILGAVSVVLAG